MKTIALSAFVLGLLVAVGFSLRTRTRPGATTQPKAVSQETDRARLPEPSAETAPSPLSLPAEKKRTRESGWSRELREMKELAAKDPDAALGRVAKLSDKHERIAAGKDVCLIVSDKDPAKALTAAWNLGIGKFDDETTENAALERLAKQWAAVDLVKAFAWASALPTDEEGRRDRVIKGIVSTVSEVTPDEAARMVTNYISPDNGVQTDALMDILRQWAARDYASAMAWAARFPEGPLRDRGIEELASFAPGQPLNHAKPQGSGASRQ